MSLWNDVQPRLGDTDNNLLSKIAQAIAEGSGGGSSGVASISINGGAAQTGAVSFSSVSSISVNGGPAQTGDVAIATSSLVNFQDTNADADASIFINSGATELFRAVGATSFIQLATARLHRDNATSTLSILSGTGKSDGAFLDLFSDSAAGSPGFAGITTKGTASFKILNAAIASLASTSRLEVTSIGNILQTPTWNDAGTDFVGFDLNATNTLSGAGTLLARFRTGATSQWQVDKTGIVTQLGQLRVPSGSAATPGYSFSSSTTSGLYLASAVGVSVSGVPAMIIRSTETIIGATSRYTWGDLVTYAVDLVLARDAANTLAQRNGANAQAFRVYNTFTDASNYERGVIKFTTNNLYIGHEFAGTGVERNVIIGAVGGTNASAIKLWTDGTIDFNAAGETTTRWSVSIAGHLIAGTDNTYDIGASGATRPRTGYFATSIVCTNTTINVNGVATNAIFFVSGCIIQTNGTESILIRNQAGTGFGLIKLGGTTSAFPAIKRNGAGIDFRLADDSAFANIASANITQSVGALLSITSGTNQRAGNATLVAGTVTVANTSVTANTIVMLTRKTSGGTVGFNITYTVTAATSFTITSDSALDTSTFSYFLIEVP